jgi:RNA polymerase sigma-70 factor (ECF subfamily)
MNTSAESTSVAEVNVHSLGDHELLIEYVQQQNTEALGILLMRYRRFLFAVLRQRLKEEADIEDVIQEVALRVIREADRYDAKRPMTTWLSIIALNELGHFLRKNRMGWKNSQGRRSYLMAELSPENDAEDFSYENDPLDIVVAAEYSEMFSTAIADLPIDDKTLVEALFFEDLSRQKFADAIGISLAVLTSRLSRIRRRLRRMLDNEKI